MAIAGYTNAGKSSLLNRLTGAGVLVENALFATLDPTVRRAQTPVGRGVHADRHRRLRPAPAAPAGRGVPVHAGGGRRGRPHPARGGRLATPTPRRRSPRSARCSPRSARATCPSWSSSTRPTCADPIVLAGPAPARSRQRRRVRAHRRGPRPSCWPRSRRALPRPTVRSTSLLPYGRGDLVARAHDEGEVLAQDRAHRRRHAAAARGCRPPWPRELEAVAGRLCPSPTVIVVTFGGHFLAD